mgnify:CR=1 FL=1
MEQLSQQYKNNTLNGYAGQCEVRQLKDIVAISAGHAFTVALGSNGEICVVGGRERSLSEANFWILFDDINNLEMERITRKQERLEEELEWRLEEERLEKEEYQKFQYRSQGRCQHCGGEFKGLFSKKCARCGKPKDYQFIR